MKSLNKEKNAALGNCFHFRASDIGLVALMALAMVWSLIPAADPKHKQVLRVPQPPHGLIVPGVPSVTR